MNLKPGYKEMVFDTRHLHLVIQQQTGWLNVVQTVKRGVKKMKSGTLSDKIARFLFAYRNTPDSTTGTTPAELLMGHKQRSPLDLLKPELHIRVEEKLEKQKQYHDRIAHQRSFAVGDLVFIRNFSRSSTDQWIPRLFLLQVTRSFRVEVCQMTHLETSY